MALIRACPIDKDIPVFDVNDPVKSKKLLKRSFVGEGCLDLISQYLDIPILAYTTRNDGDFFQDVYYHRKYKSTQTQKSDSELYFHNDRTAHLVRADVLCLLGMRSDPKNVIITKYIHGEDVLALMDANMVDVLQQPFFITPFDLFSKDSNKYQAHSERHAILINDAELRYYDTRTTVAEGAPDVAWKALVALKDAITKAPKLHIVIRAGDLFIFPNLAGLHSRDKAYVTDLEAAQQRYLLKTYNFWSSKRRDEYAHLFVPGVPGLIDDDRLYGDKK